MTVVAQTLFMSALRFLLSQSSDVQCTQRKNGHHPDLASKRKTKSVDDGKRQEEYHKVSNNVEGRVDMPENRQIDTCSFNGHIPHSVNWEAFDNGRYCGGDSV